MAARESINRIKIEQWRVSRVPINPATTVYQGDLMVWDVANKIAVGATAASAGTFLGVSDTKNPIETIGSTTFLSDSQNARINVVQKGLVEMVFGESATVYPWDYLTVGADAQTVLQTGATISNCVGVADPAIGAAGKAYVSGDLIKLWLRVPARYASI